MEKIKYQVSRAALYDSGQHPPDFVEQPHKLSLPALCAELSRLVYLRFDPDPLWETPLEVALKRPGLLTPEPFGDWATGTQALGVIRASTRQAIVVFRGTELKVADIGTDLQATLQPFDDGSKVHYGFYKSFVSVREKIKQWLDHTPHQGLVVTGHSLGGALATLAAREWRADDLITFGSPRVGNEKFRDAIRSRVERYVNCCDVVTQVPPDYPEYYVHVGETKYIDREGVLQPGYADNDIRQDQVDALLSYPAKYSWLSGSVTARNLADHAPLNYLRALLP